MKRLFFIFSLSLLFTALIPVMTLASEQSVRVGIPTFQVTLNDTPVDSLYREYPLIVYKDITYFPMTYYDCRYLGLETVWNEQLGLGINNTGISGLYRSYNSSSMNKRNDVATICPFPVQVNSQLLDNAHEKYPLLLFRDVTYFPMTWRFCVDEFGWEYAFNESDGLVIKSANPTVAKLNILFSEEDSLSGFGAAFTVANDLYYFRGANREIYQGRISNPEARQVVYQIEGSSMAGLSTQDHQVYLHYHVGGATLGSDVTIHLKADGTWEQISNGKLNLKDYGDISIMATQWLPPQKGNLYIKYGNGEYEPVGDPDYAYGYFLEKGENERGGGPSPALYLIHDDIYVLAYDKLDDLYLPYDKTKDEGTTGIYKVNTKTNVTSCVVEGPVYQFIIEGDYIYYHHMSDHRIYRAPLSGGPSEPLTESVSGNATIKDMEVLNGQVLQMPVEQADWKSQLFRAGEKGSINPDAGEPGISSHEGYLLAFFEKADGSAYRLMIFNANGEVIFKTSDDVMPGTVSIENDQLYYADAGLGQVGKVLLLQR